MSLANTAAFAVLLGASLAAGLLLMAVRVPRWASPSLARRVAPYLRDIADPRGLTPLASPLAVVGWAALRDRAAAAWGGGDALAKRLRQAARSQDVVAFRASQLGWAVAGLAAGGVLAVIAALTGRGGLVAVLLPPLCAVLAVVACDYRLTREARARLARVEEELPTVLEFLALCLAAGEGLRDALHRVGEVGSGVLTGELRGAVLASGTGSNLPDALLDVAKVLDVPALARAVEHLVAAMDRGAPLAHVLQEQAVDAREDAKRALIESAGRKEIFMLLPYSIRCRYFFRGADPVECTRRMKLPGLVRPFFAINECAAIASASFHGDWLLPVATTRWELTGVFDPIEDANDLGESRTARPLLAPPHLHYELVDGGCLWRVDHNGGFHRDFHH